MTQPSLDQPLRLLGNLSPNQFMQQYWQKKPLLIRQAIPNIQPPITEKALFSLVKDEFIESRLVEKKEKNWSVKYGPFQRLPAKTKKDWTLLVQGLDLYIPQAKAILAQFRFIPDARLDDLMISYATPGGGVGPHDDSYDVFLLQVKGSRHWKIAQQYDPSVIPNLPLKVLSDFQAEQEWILKPGDMLYLPPKFAHDGVAIDECLTCSIGFRSPSFAELKTQFFYFLAEQPVFHQEEALRYRDPDQTATNTPAAIPEKMLAQVTDLLHQIQSNKIDIHQFLGTYLSIPKENIFFISPESPLSEKAWQQQLQTQLIELSPKTILLYDSAHFYINGETFLANSDQIIHLMKKLANNRSLSTLDLDTLTACEKKYMVNILYKWYGYGWIA